MPPHTDWLRGLPRRLHGQRVRAVIESTNGARFVHDTLEEHGWELLSWGSNQDGQLGNATSGADNATPALIANLDDVTRIAAGSHTSFAVHTDGSMSAWGRNDSGQLATANASNQTAPTTISAPSLTDEHYAYNHEGLRTGARASPQRRSAAIGAASPA